jgi:hypothetical protein
LKGNADLFFPLSPFHGFGWRYYNLVPAFGANVSFAGGAGKTVAARAVELLFIPRFSAMDTAND